MHHSTKFMPCGQCVCSAALVGQYLLQFIYVLQRAIGYLTFLVLFGIIACIHGGCSSVVERQIVDLVVVGSNPITHPFTFMLDAQTFINQSVLGITENAPVAQLDRATDFESVGRTFEPCRAHFFTPMCIFIPSLLLFLSRNARFVCYSASLSDKAFTYSNPLRAKPSRSSSAIK